jgi:hypothetical protein
LYQFSGNQIIIELSIYDELKLSSNTYTNILLFKANEKVAIFLMGYLNSFKKEKY